MSIYKVVYGSHTFVVIARTKNHALALINRKYGEMITENDVTIEENPLTEGVKVTISEDN